MVDAKGKVEKAGQGAYFEKKQKEIEDYFGAKLPGLQEVAATAATPLR